MKDIWYVYYLLPAIGDKRITWIPGRPKLVIAKLEADQIFVMDAQDNFIFEKDKEEFFIGKGDCVAYQQDLNQRWKERIAKDAKWQAKQKDKQWLESLEKTDLEKEKERREMMAMVARPDLTKTAKLYYLRLKYKVSMEDVGNYIKADPSSINAVWTDSPTALPYKPIDLKIHT